MAGSASSLGGLLARSVPRRAQAQLEPMGFARGVGYTCASSAVCLGLFMKAGVITEPVQPAAFSLLISTLCGYRIGDTMNRGAEPHCLTQGTLAGLAAVLVFMPK